ncbi:hypothetical protein K1X76_04090 [bacterium]|nr:hypothetical protein [bacterium]
MGDKMLGCYLKKITKALPKDSFYTEEFYEFLKPKISDELFETLIGLNVAKRYSVVKNYPQFIDGKTHLELNESTVELGYKAATQCLDETGLHENDVGLFICATNASDRILPGSASEILARLNPRISPSVPHLNIQGMGCSSLLKSVETASWFLKANPNKYVLVVISEGQTPLAPQVNGGRYFSFKEINESRMPAEEKLINKRRTETVIQSLLFGDGAIAMVLSAHDGAFAFDAIHHLTNREPTDPLLLTMNEGGSRFPYVSHQTLRPSYNMSEQVPLKGIYYSKTTVDAVLNDKTSPHNNIENFDHYFIHTGSQKILKGVCKNLGVLSDSPKTDIAFSTLRNHANVSSASVGLMVHQSISSLKGSALIVSFGVGFSATAGTIRSV